MSVEGDAGLQELEQLEADASVIGRAGDVSTLARRSLLNFAGGAAFGFLSFAWLIVVTRGWGAARSGVLLEAVAFFTIATTLVVLGSEESVVRAVARARSLRAASTRHILLVALVPIFLVSIAVAVVVWIAAPEVAKWFGTAAEQEELSSYVRIFAPVLPFTAMYFAILAATRGFGTMVPTVVIERIGRNLSQVVLAGLVIAFGGGVLAMGLAWGLPFAVGMVFAAIRLRRLIRGDDLAGTGPSVPPPLSATAGEFWRFSGFRGLASIFQVTLLWVDLLLVGALLSASGAAIYTTSSRTVRLGSVVVLLALTQAIAPQMSELFAKKETRRAEHVYRTSAWWTMTLTWPFYLTLALFAPAVLGIFGPDFATGAVVVVTMSAAMLVSTAIGPVDMVLLMGGKSGWNLLNTVVALVTDIVLILILVPHLGIEGAAIAWATSVVLNNVLPWLEVKLLLGVTPFATPGLIPASTAIVSFGVVGVLARISLGPTFPAAVLAIAVATPIYVLLLRRFGQQLEFDSLFSTLRPRGRRAA